MNMKSTQNSFSWESLFDRLSLLRRELTLKGYEDICFYVKDKDRRIEAVARMKTKGWGYQECHFTITEGFFDYSDFDVYLSAEVIAK